MEASEPQATVTRYGVFVQVPALVVITDAEGNSEAAAEPRDVWLFVAEEAGHNAKPAMVKALEQSEDDAIPQKSTVLAVPKSRMSHEPYELEPPKARGVKLG